MTNTLGAPPPAIKEVDFYKSPTILSRLILNQKYTSAMKRLHRFPEEASTWVSSKRNPYRGRCNSFNPAAKRGGIERFSSGRFNLPRIASRNLEYSIRQLPIHVACANLLKASEDVKLRADLEKLITKLVITFPNSCHEADHEGKLPLHEALWNEAKPQTISMMLIAAPLTLHARDKYGRSPLDLNGFRRGEEKKQIMTMLMKGTHFWEKARAAAVTRMEEQMKTVETEASDFTDKVSGSSQMTKESKKEESKKEEPEKVHVTTWFRLERRAIHLEQLLAELYEKNYELGEMVEALSQQKMEIEDENERFRSTAPLELPGMNDEIERLNFQIQSLEERLASTSDTSIETPDNDTLDFLEGKNGMLQSEVDQLTARNREYQMEVERLEILVDSFRKRLEESPRVSTNIIPIPEDEATTYTDDLAFATQDFNELLETIESKSHYATERYLIRKVRRLQDQLDQKAQTGEMELALAREQNRSLIRENEALLVQLASVRRRSIYIERSNKSSLHQSTPVEVTVKKSVGSEEFKDLEDSFQVAAVIHSENPMYDSEGAGSERQSSLSEKVYVGDEPESTTPVDSDEIVPEDEEVSNGLMEKNTLTYQSTGSTHSVRSNQSLPKNTARDHVAENSANSFGSDNLDDIFEVAAATHSNSSRFLSEQLGSEGHISFSGKLGVGNEDGSTGPFDSKKVHQDDAAGSARLLEDQKLSSQSTSSKHSGRSNQSYPKRRTYDDVVREDSVKSFGSDNLDDIFQVAATMYSQSPRSLSKQSRAEKLMGNVSAGENVGSTDPVDDGKVGPTVGGSVGPIETGELSSQSKGTARSVQSNHMLPTRSSPVNGPTEDSANSFGSDNLDEIFQTVAAKPGSSSRSLAESGSERQSSLSGKLDVDNEVNSNKADQENTSGSGGVMEQKNLERAELSHLPFAEIVSIAKEIYRKPLSASLDSALHLAAVSTTLMTMREFIMDVQDRFQNPIPPDFEDALSQALLRVNNKEKMETVDSKQLNKSFSQSTTSSWQSISRCLSVETEVAAIFEEAVRVSGVAIPTEFVSAFQHASIAYFVHHGVTESPVLHLEQSPDRDFEEVFKEAQRMYGKSISPEIMNAIKRASVASMNSWKNMASVISSTTTVTSEITFDDEIEALLDEVGETLGEEVPQDFAKVFREATLAEFAKGHGSLESVVVPNFQNVMRETERRYGKEIPKQLLLALKDSSLSSGCLHAGSGEYQKIYRPVVRRPSIGDEGFDQERKALTSVQESTFLNSRKQIDLPTRNGVTLLSDDDVDNTSQGNELLDENEDASSSGSEETDADEMIANNDTDSILREAELLAGTKLSASLVAAWRNIHVPSYESKRDVTRATSVTKHQSGSFYHFSHASMQSENTNFTNVDGDILGFVNDDLEAIFSEAARVYRGPVKSASQKMTPVFSNVRKTNVSDEANAKAARIRKTIGRAAFAGAKELSIASSTQSDDLEDMYSQAAASMTS